MVNRQSEHLEEARRIFVEIWAQITTERKRYLGPVICVEEYKKKYIRDTIEKCVSEVSFLLFTLKLWLVNLKQHTHAIYTTSYQKQTHHLKENNGNKIKLPALWADIKIEERRQSNANMEYRLTSLRLKNGLWSQQTAVFRRAPSDLQLAS